MLSVYKVYKISARLRVYKYLATLLIAAMTPPVIQDLIERNTSCTKYRAKTQALEENYRLSFTKFGPVSSTGKVAQSTKVAIAKRKREDEERERAKRRESLIFRTNLERMAGMGNNLAPIPYRVRWARMSDRAAKSVQRKLDLEEETCGMHDGDKLPGRVSHWCFSSVARRITRWWWSNPKQ